MFVFGHVQKKKHFESFFVQHLIAFFHGYMTSRTDELNVQFFYFYCNISLSLAMGMGGMFPHRDTRM
jgi:hypothetical protein